MANFNGADHLAMALRSVLAQSIERLEVFLLDDASTDDSISVASQIADVDSRVRVFDAAQNAGPGVARNRGLEAATGEWIAIVDSDDIIHPRRFERMIDASRELDTDAVADDLTYFHDAGIRPAGTLLGASRPGAPTSLTAARFVSANPDAPQLGYLKPMIRRAALSGLRYREDIRIGEDHDFYMRFLLNGGRMHLLPQSYYLYRRHSDSLSHRMHPDDVATMISVQDDLLHSYPELSDEMRAHLGVRRAALQQPLAFETLAQHIRNRDLGRATRLVACKPLLLTELARVGKAHLVRRFFGSAKSPVVVARDPTKWTLQDWAAVASPKETG